MTISTSVPFRQPQQSRWLSVVALSLALAFGLGACGSGSDATAPATTVAGGGSRVSVAEGNIVYHYIIPPGTGAAVDAGELVQVMPNELFINRGDAVQVENRDNRGHTVGPFFVGEGETVSQVFNSEATYVGVCTVTPEGEIRIIVT